MLGFGHVRQVRDSWLSRARPAAPAAADFGRSSVRLLQLAPGATEYMCTAATEIPGTVAGGSGPQLDAATMAARIRDALDGQGFRGGRIAVTLQAELFQADMARLPAMPDHELAETVRFEATDRFGIDREGHVIGHLRLGATAGGSSEVLMLAVPRSAVTAACAALGSRDTHALRIEHAALSALRAMGRQRASECDDPADARDWAMLHLEDRVATLVLLRDGAVAFMRAIRGDWAPAGPTKLQRTQAGKPINLGGDDPIPLDGAPGEGSASWRWCTLAEEVLRCLRHFERSTAGWWPREVSITGPAAMDPQAAATVESVCGVRASLAVPIRMIDEPEACIHGNAWVAAIGAACAELPALARNPRAIAVPRKATGGRGRASGDTAGGTRHPATQGGRA